MLNDPAVATPAESINSHGERYFYHYLSWGAVLGGTVAAMGIHLLLSALGMGAGLATFTPMTDTNPVAHFNAGAAIIWSLCAILALWFGGLIAGRFSRCAHAAFAHGILVWSLSLIITMLLLSLGTGMILGGAMKVLGEGVGIGGKIAASGVSEAAQEGTKRSGDQLASFIDEAVQSVPTNAAPKAAIRAKREVGFAVAKLFTPGNEVNSRDNQLAVVKALMDYTQMNETDATKTVDDWVASYNNLNAELDTLKARAEQKAREAADRAAHHVACAAIWSFFALLAGLMAAAFGARCGARQALRHAKTLQVIVP